MNSVSTILSPAGPAEISEAKINISNLRLRTYIGFNPEEKTKQQGVIVNAEIWYRADLACASDDAADALNYKNITKRMIQHIENGRFQLLEKLTAELLAIASAAQQVSYAEVRVDKPHALRFADSVSVTLSAHRRRAD
ncbi:MAG: D-erythro-7,8-dihydroneopterin triphosphate epimerase [Olavius algarvensis Gamma 3 endosymbiont]|nr:MAG: D-erythro-7,8-dihydroneopterin triphosphate epimerase [Olavius algarvensis Gamma 3 endosymbiont]